MEKKKLKKTPEATPYVGYYDEFKPKKEVSFWDKVKNFLGF